MLAIFGKSVATRPDMLPDPDPCCDDSLRDDNLVGCFSTVYDCSVVHVDSSVLFAFDVPPPDSNLSTASPIRTIFGNESDCFCMFQGEMKYVDALRGRYGLTGEVTEAIILIRIFKMLREVRLQTPKFAVLDMMGDFSFVLYDKLSKCVMVASDNSQQFPLFWGLDSEYALVISDDAGVVASTCALTSVSFPQGKVYISCRGRAGLEAIFMDSTPEEETHLQQVQSDVDSRIEQLQRTGRPLIKSWQPPSRPDVFKVNTKGLVFTNDNSIGIGVVIRNWRGQIRMALSRKIKGFTRSTHAEELAIVEGLRMAHKEGISHVLLETNAFKVGLIRDQGAYYALLRSLRAAFIAGFRYFGHLVTNEDANKAAYGLAKYAQEVDDSIAWHEEIPQCISDIVLMDSNTQGQGTCMEAHISVETLDESK